MGGLLHLVQRWGTWAGCGPAQSPPRCIKCNSPPINDQCTNHGIAIMMVRCSAVLMWPWRVKTSYREGSSGMDGGTATKLTATVTGNFCWTEPGSQLTTEQCSCHVELTNLRRHTGLSQLSSVQSSKTMHSIHNVVTFLIKFSPISQIY